MERCQQFGYTYDSIGNIASHAAPGKGTITYTYDNQGQLLKAAGDTTYTYDGAGNILTASNGATTHSYTYGTRWNFTWANGWSLSTASDGTNSLSFAYDPGGLPYVMKYNGTVYYYITNL